MCGGGGEGLSDQYLHSLKFAHVHLMDGWAQSPHNLLLGFKLDFSVVGLGAGGFGTVWGRTRVGLTQST